MIMNGGLSIETKFSTERHWEKRRIIKAISDPLAWNNKIISIILYRLNRKRNKINHKLFKWLNRPN